MDTRAIYEALLAAVSSQEVQKIFESIKAAEPDRVSLVPVGGRKNNSGAIEVAADAGRSLIERVTNAQDALLEHEFKTHSGKPECKSPREGAEAWLGVPKGKGLSGLSTKNRQDLAEKVIVRVDEGEGPQSRLVSVIDKGVGLFPGEIKGTILSLNESNKITKHYLAGTYGQGGSSTLAFSKYVMLASRKAGSEKIGFTIACYENLPAEDYKIGRYSYLTLDGEVFCVEASSKDQEHGTIIRHFGFDLSQYSSALGPKSIYGILGRILFDPVTAIRFENRVNGWNRTIKGARNALNGAVDDGDDATRGPKLDHHIPMFNIDMGDLGFIGIEYWVLSPIIKDGKRKKSKPANNFVDATKPIILSHNGQNQGELTGRLIKVDADLPFLYTQGRIICHINCDNLSPYAKRHLFSSTREKSRDGVVLDKIKVEIIGALRGDDDLVRYNEEAKEQSLVERDEDAQKRMRSQVAKLLRFAGASLAEVGGKNKSGDDEPKPSPNPRPKPLAILPSDPPSYIKIIWDDDKKIPMYRGQRRYLRLETDAMSDYYNSDEPEKSRINIVIDSGLKVFGTSPLKAGRMRIGIECLEETVVSSTGLIKVELYRPSLSTLSDERVYEVVEQPEKKERSGQNSFPKFDILAVSGPSDENWPIICGDEESNDVTKFASNSIQDGETLLIYYSDKFPRFATELKRMEQKSAAMANSFRTRYETWLAVHSLLMFQDEQNEEAADVELGEAQRENLLHQERCRYAIIASMISSQEVKDGINANLDEDAA